MLTILKDDMGIKGKWNPMNICGNFKKIKIQFKYYIKIEQNKVYSIRKAAWVVRELSRMK